MRIWLDDVRLPPLDSGVWTHLTTAEEAWATIETLGLSSIHEISFDNDLGIGRMEGHELATKIELLVAVEKLKLIPEMRVHSANPVAVVRLGVIIARIGTIAYNNQTIAE